jgi:hypothetical protein
MSSTCSQCNAPDATYMSSEGEALCSTCFQEGEIGEQEMRAHDARAGGFLAERQARFAMRSLLGGGVLGIAGVACLAVAATRKPFDSDFLIVGVIAVAIAAFLLLSARRRG